MSESFIRRGVWVISQHIRGIHVQLLFHRFSSNEVVIVDARRVENSIERKSQCGPIPPRQIVMQLTHLAILRPFLS